MAVPVDYVERVYAGWLGKVIGVRHGGNVEGWSYDRLLKTYGEITGYLHEFINFAADDDTNGPMAFLRALVDYTHTREITAEQMGLGLLNYAPDHHGFFWWGGYGNSTENTAYVNLKQGIMAPRSGSIEQNGAAAAEQIGGQIFIDVWGLIAPGAPEMAAEYAGKMASVTHDGNGVYGGQFIAACIAAAFVERDMHKILEAGLFVIPADCEYARMTRDIMTFHAQHPESWRDCFHYVHDHWGYDRYPGVCHIIPNSAVIVLSLLYGEGDFSRAVNVCNMCGWDTDCNVANVGTIMGVRNGLDGIEYHWRKPINDFLCCSTVLGRLNIVDLPWCAAFIASLGHKIAGEPVPARWAPILEQTAPRLHFELPGSTHAIRLSSDAASDPAAVGHIENTTDAASTGSRSLRVIFREVAANAGYRAYHQTYYRPRDFNDSRYDPGFSPILYPGQQVRAAVMVPNASGGSVHARLYVLEGNCGKRVYGESAVLEPGQWQTLAFSIPRMENVCLEQVGVEWRVEQSVDGPFVAYLDHLDFGGRPDYAIDFASERHEVWHGTHIEVSQLTYLRGLWRLCDGELTGSYAGEPAESYTGDLDWRDYDYEVELVPKLGAHHHILFRVQGGIRSYVLGLSEDQRITLYKNDNGYRPLASAPFAWERDTAVRIGVEARGNLFRVRGDGAFLFAYADDDAPYLNGQIGFGNMGGSRTHYRGFTLKGLE